MYLLWYAGYSRCLSIIMSIIRLYFLIAEVSSVIICVSIVVLWCNFSLAS